MTFSCDFNQAVRAPSPIKDSHLEIAECQWAVADASPLSLSHTGTGLAGHKRLAARGCLPEFDVRNSVQIREEASSLARNRGYEEIRLSFK
jgi:hypothetical protein